MPPSIKEPTDCHLEVSPVNPPLSRCRSAPPPLSAAIIDCAALVILQLCWCSTPNVSCWLLSVGLRALRLSSAPIKCHLFTKKMISFIINNGCS